MASKKIKLSDVKKSINKKLKEDGKSGLDGYEEIKEYIEETNLLPGKKLAMKGITLLRVSVEVADNIREHFCPGAKTTAEPFGENIYVYAPNIGMVYVPKRKITSGMTQEEKQKIPILNVVFNRYHMVNLGHLSGEFDEEFTMRDCADYIIRTNPMAREVTFAEYNRAHTHGWRAASTGEQGGDQNPRGAAVNVKLAHNNERNVRYKGTIYYDTDASGKA